MAAAAATPAAAAAELKAQGFSQLDETSVKAYIEATPTLMVRLGDSIDALQVKEVGDGNMNFVFIVSSDAGSDARSVVVKQALPYVRRVGHSLPMTRKRAYFEAWALLDNRRRCPDHVPEVYHFDRAMSLIVMHYIKPPHIILRKGLIAGKRYPLLSEHMAEYMARTLFYTSLLHNSTMDHKKRVARYSTNVEMCRLTEKLVFSDPYRVSEDNRITPSLNKDAEAVRDDDELKMEIAELKSMFSERAQALIHGDLHTGSIMLTPQSTQVIDPEYAFYGPMGYDIGAFLGNLILSYFAQDGAANQENDRKDYKEWILKTIKESWNFFQQKFVELWNKDGNGEAYPRDIYNSPLLNNEMKKYMRSLFHDSLGFGSAIMIARIIGLANVEDFEKIEDTKGRASCERRALHCAKKILKVRRQCETIEQVIAHIRAEENSEGTMPIQQPQGSH